MRTLALAGGVRVVSKEMHNRWLQARSWVASVTAVTALMLLSWWLLVGSDGRGTRWVHASYDASYSLRLNQAAQISNSPVVMVYLDGKTFVQFGQDPARPLDRRFHAQLVRRLTRAGAKMVVFDVLFEDPALDPSTDREFASALREQGGVILGAEWRRREHNRADQTAVVQFRETTLPDPQLLAAAAGYGFVFLKPDADFTVRESFEGFPERNLLSLAAAAAKRWGLPPVPHGERHWLNYYGPPESLPGVYFLDALDPSAVPDSFFRGKIVLIGTLPGARQFGERRDEWRSPVGTGGGGGVLLMPAVEVHGTELLNRLRGDWWRRFPLGVELGLLAMTSGLLVFGLRPFRPWPAAGLALGFEVAFLASVAVGLNGFRTWFPWLIVAAVQVPGAWCWSLLMHSLEWYRQRRRLQAQIFEQAALLDKAQDAILVMDLAGQVRYRNPAARRLYGPTGTGLELEPEARLAAARAAAVSTGEWSGELLQRAADGRPLTVASRWTLLRHPTGEPDGLLYINTDISERRRLEAQLLRMERLETVGVLAGGMAHDLNNMLSPILMGAQLLRRQAVEPGAERMLATIEESAQRGSEMVQEVLRFARGREGEAIPVRLDELLRDLAHWLRGTLPRGITVEVLVPPDLWPTQGYPTQLRQVLLNLCLNARDSMPNGGQLTLAADNVPPPAESMSPPSDGVPGRQVVVLVSDTGAGIPESVREHLFEPFFTTKSAGRGSGLGLSTSAAIVKRHGGVLMVKSELGVGSCFEVYLPAWPPG